MLFQYERAVFSQYGIHRPGVRNVIAPTRAGARDGHDTNASLLQSLERMQRLGWQAAVQGDGVVNVSEDPVNARPVST